MKKNNIKKICDKALNIRYSNVQLLDVDVMLKHKYDYSNNKWIFDSWFLIIKIKSGDDEIKFNEIENYIESLIGFECSINF
jgi:hypothetical protein